MRGQTSWGVVDPHGRRADHGPRRRRRPARPAPPRARSRSWCCSSATRTAPAEAADGSPRELRARRACGSELDARIDLSLRPPGRRLGAEGRARAHRGRAPRPRRPATSPWCGATPASKAHGAGRGGRAPGAVTARAHPGRAARRGDSPAETPHRRRSRPSRRRSRRPPTGSPALPWAMVGTEGEDRMRAGRRHRALPAAAPDGIAARVEDDRAGPRRRQ